MKERPFLISHFAQGTGALKTVLCEQLQTALLGRKLSVPDITDLELIARPDVFGRDKGDGVVTARVGNLGVGLARVHQVGSCLVETCAGDGAVAHAAVALGQRLVM